MELAVSAGLQVVHTTLEEDRAAICGPRYQHRATRTASRTGTVPSEVILGGRKVQIRRPGVRDGDEPILDDEDRRALDGCAAIAVEEPRADEQHGSR